MVSEMVGGQQDHGGGLGASQAADVWSFGCLLLHMLSGSPPWPGLSVLQLCRKVGGRALRCGGRTAPWLLAAGC
jgi:serine/threonine protein kinase